MNRFYSIAMLAYRGEEIVLGAWSSFADSVETAKGVGLDRIRADYPAADGWKHDAEIQSISLKALRLWAVTEAQQPSCANPTHSTACCLVDE